METLYIITLTFIGSSACVRQTNGDIKKKNKKIAEPVLFRDGVPTQGRIAGPIGWRPLVAFSPVQMRQRQRDSRDSRNRAGLV